MILSNSFGKNCGKYFNKLKEGIPPHAHQAKILKCPQDENFIVLPLFMRIQLIFFVLGSYQFLKLMD
ncbi:hypothetical protein OCB07_30015, partial [Bacillus cereus]|nr:hypothetical protein [Bacillus cereus]